MGIDNLQNIKLTTRRDVFYTPTYLNRFTINSKVKRAGQDRCIATIRDLRETIESGPPCITDLFQNKSVAYFNPPKNTCLTFSISFLSICYATFQCGRYNI